MAKRVIFAVAGSGKTSYIVNQLNTVERSLVITFTNNNYNNIQQKIISNYGYFPKNIKVFTYFSFLHSFCYKPLLFYKYETRGINYKWSPSRYAKGNARFIDKNKRLFYNRISELLNRDGELNSLKARIEKYFDKIFIDEIQDFAGHDFNFIKNIARANLGMLFVGDFYQHTYDTSRDGTVNANLHKDYERYKNQFVQIGINVDTESLSRSYRCSPTVCNFITNSTGIEIHSHRDTDTIVKFITNQDEAREIIESNDIVKLFYKMHSQYNCYSYNWGESKGADHFNDVCVVLYKEAAKYYRNNELYKLTQLNKNRFYVACSRSRGNLYLLTNDYFN